MEYFSCLKNANMMLYDNVYVPFTQDIWIYLKVVHNQENIAQIIWKKMSNDLQSTAIYID